LLPQIKSKGYDWEQTGTDHTTDSFNNLMRQTHATGFINILTSTAERQYQWSAPNTDATGINWGNIDYFVSQLYGASGGMDPAWKSYVDFLETKVVVLVYTVLNLSHHQ
jgi:hypothetical protein